MMSNDGAGEAVHLLEGLGDIFAANEIADMARIVPLINAGGYILPDDLARASEILHSLMFKRTQMVTYFDHVFLGVRGEGSAPISPELRASIIHDMTVESELVPNEIIQLYKGLDAMPVAPDTPYASGGLLSLFDRLDEALYAREHPEMVVRTQRSASGIRATLPTFDINLGALAPAASMLAMVAVLSVVGGLAMSEHASAQTSPSPKYHTPTEAYNTARQIVDEFKVTGNTFAIQVLPDGRVQVTPKRGYEAPIVTDVEHLGQALYQRGYGSPAAKPLPQAVAGGGGHGLPPGAQVVSGGGKGDTDIPTQDRLRKMGQGQGQTLEQKGALGTLLSMFPSVGSKGLDFGDKGSVQFKGGTGSDINSGTPVDSQGGATYTNKAKTLALELGVKVGDLHFAMDKAAGRYVAMYGVLKRLIDLGGGTQGLVQLDYTNAMEGAHVERYMGTVVVQDGKKYLAVSVVDLRQKMETMTDMGARYFIGEAYGGGVEGKYAISDAMVASLIGTVMITPTRAIKVGTISIQGEDADRSYLHERFFPGSADFKIQPNVRMTLSKFFRLTVGGGIHIVNFAKDLGSAADGTAMHGHDRDTRSLTGLLKGEVRFNERTQATLDLRYDDNSLTTSVGVGRILIQGVEVRATFQHRDTFGHGLSDGRGSNAVLVYFVFGGKEYYAEYSAEKGLQPLSLNSYDDSELHAAMEQLRIRYGTPVDHTSLVNTNYNRAPTLTLGTCTTTLGGAYSCGITSTNENARLYSLPVARGAAMDADTLLRTGHVISATKGVATTIAGTVGGPGDYDLVLVGVDDHVGGGKMVTSVKRIPFTINAPLVPAVLSAGSVDNINSGAGTGTGHITTTKAGTALYSVVNTTATMIASDIIAANHSQAVGAAGAQTIPLTGLVVGTNYLHLVEVGPDGTSNVVDTTFNVTSPLVPAVLSAGSVGSFNAALGTGAASVTTDKVGTNLYSFVSTNAVESAATIIAANHSQAIGAVGVQTVNYTGATAGATNYLHLVEVGPDGTSNVINVTDATPVLSGAVAPSGINAVSADFGFSTSAKGTVYWYPSTNATELAATITAANHTQAANATGAQTVHATGLTKGTTGLHIHSVVVGFGGTSSVMDSAAFNTLSGPTGVDESGIQIDTAGAPGSGSVVFSDSHGSIAVTFASPTANVFFVDADTNIPIANDEGGVPGAFIKVTGIVGNTVSLSWKAPVGHANVFVRYQPSAEGLTSVDTDGVAGPVL